MDEQGICPFMYQMGFLVLISCLSSHLLERKAHVPVFERCWKVERKCHLKDCVWDSCVSERCLPLFKDVFAHLLQVLPCGKLATACPFLFCMHRHSPVRWIAKLFFFYFKRPLASSVCVGCYVEGGRKRKGKRIPPIAVLIPEPPHSSFCPRQGHFHTSSWQNTTTNKKVLLLLRGKWITHLLHWEVNSNPFSGLSLERSLCSFPKFHTLW